MFLIPSVGQGLTRARLLEAFWILILEPRRSAGCCYTLRMTDSGDGGDHHHYEHDGNRQKWTRFFFPSTAGTITMSSSAVNVEDGYITKEIAQRFPNEPLR